MKKILIILSLLLAVSSAQATTFTVECDEASGQCDGSTLKPFVPPAPLPVPEKPNPLLDPILIFTISNTAFLIVILILQIWMLRKKNEPETYPLPQDFSTIGGLTSIPPEEKVDY